MPETNGAALVDSFISDMATVMTPEAVTRIVEVMAPYFDMVRAGEYRLTSFEELDRDAVARAVAGVLDLAEPPEIIGVSLSEPFPVPLWTTSHVCGLIVRDVLSASRYVQLSDLLHRLDLPVYCRTSGCQAIFNHSNFSNKSGLNWCLMKLCEEMLPHPSNCVHFSDQFAITLMHSSYKIFSCWLRALLHGDKKLVLRFEKLVSAQAQGCLVYGFMEPELKRCLVLCA